MSHSKADNWERALSEIITLHRTTPFKWGSHDCAVFAANVIWAISGEDPARELRGTYKSAQQAKGALKRRGHTLLSFVDSKFARLQRVSMAKRGDLVFYRDEKSPFKGSLGVCEGLYSWFADEHGLKPIKTADCHHAWRV